MDMMVKTIAKIGDKARLKNRFNNIFIIISILIGLALLGYTTYRAYDLSFTHDESRSYYNTSNLNFIQILSTANTHLVNTFFMKIISDTLGKKELTLRMPNLLAHVLFISFSILILKTNLKGFHILSGFIFLNINPFILDFFSLARGYGIGLGFMTVSIYLLLLCLNEDEMYSRKRLIIKSVSIGALSVLAHPIFLNYFLALLISILLIEIFHHKPIHIIDYKSWIVKYKDLIRFNTLVLIFLLPFPIVLKLKEDLYFGGNNGFWQDTVNSLIMCSFYGQQYSTSILIFVKLIIILTLLLSTIVALKQYLKKRHLDPLSVLLIILLVSVFLPVCQHYLLGIPYLVERTAILYIPMFLLVLCFLFSSLTELKLKWVYSLIIAIYLGIAGLYTFNSCKTMNFSHSYTWKYDSSSKYLLRDLEAIRKGNSSLRLNVNWIFRPTLEYYKSLRSYNWLKLRSIDKDLYYDYQLEELPMSFFNVPKSSMPLNKSEWFNLFKHEGYYYVVCRNPKELRLLQHFGKILRYYPLSRSCLIHKI